MTKAYNDPTFMGGDAARPVRILSEYLEPRERLLRLGIKRALIVWGSARLRPHAGDPVDNAVDFYAHARELTARMARWTRATHARAERYVVCTGGGPGIMEAANRGAADVDRRLSMGCNIDLPAEQGSNGYIDADLNFDFHYFFMRKFWFMNVAEAMIVFPGGFGTMDELFEMLTLIQTRRTRQIPVVLFGRDFWRRLIDFDAFVSHGLIAPEDAELFVTVDSVDEAVERLCAALPA